MPNLISASPSPTNPDLWEKIQRLVKGDIKTLRHKGETIQGPRDGKGFKVFPSAYANQWASKLYKRLGGKWKATASYITRLEAAYDRLIWTPTQVHRKIAAVLPLLNEKMPNGIFLQATVEANDDVPVVRVLLGPKDPYTAERLGSFAFYSTARGMEWCAKQVDNPTPFEPHMGTVVVTYFCDLDPKRGEVLVGQVNLADSNEEWCRLMSSAPCPAFQDLTPDTRLEVLAKAVDRTAIVILCRDLLKKYFHDLGEFPIPRIEIVNNPKSDWLGRCKMKSNNLSNSIMQIQRRILGDDATLKRVLAHELIHHVDYITHFRTGNDWRALKFRDGHGKFFQERAAKINAIEGHGFVTKESDESYVESLDKEYFMLIKLDDNRFMYAWSMRPSTKQKAYIARYLEKDSRLVKSKDIRWTKGMPIGKGFSVPIKPDGQQALKELYEHGAKAHV